MIEGLIEALLSQVRQLFHAGSSSALEMVLDALQAQPIPTLNEDIFRSLYVRVWGFAVLASLITGSFGALVGSTSRRRGMSLAQSLLYFLRVYVQAIVLPLAVAFGLFASALLVDAALSTAPGGLDSSTLVDLPGMAGVADELIATFLAFLNWGLGWLLAFWVLILTWGVLPLMVIAVALSPLAPLGKDPGQFMRKSYIWLAVAIAGKLVIAVVIMVGATFVDLISQLGVELVVQLFQMATMLAAIWLSLGLRSKFDQSDAIAVWIPTPITAKVTAAGQAPSPNLQAVRTGVHTSRQQLKTSERHHQPARVRQAAASGLTATAASSPDPRVKGMAAAGAYLVNRSANKARAKAEGADNDGA